MQLAPYLFFDGTCEEALAFYETVFGGTTVSINRFEGSPMAESMPPDQLQRIMHASFEAPGVSFMASDSNEHSTGEMNRVALSVASGDHAEGERTFDALTAGGKVIMPYTKQFWGASFGILVDKYGIRWMVNAG